MTSKELITLFFNPLLSLLVLENLNIEFSTLITVPTAAFTVVESLVLYDTLRVVLEAFL